MDSFDDLRDNRRIRQRRDITQAVLLAAQDLPQDTAHDLAAAGLREVLDDVDALGGSKRPDRLADLHDEVLAYLLIRLVALL